MQIGRTYHPGRPCPFLLLLVKLALIPVGAELDTRQPRRRPAHLLTNGIQRYLRRALYNQLVMHVPNDLAVAQGPHGVSQDVPADGLHDVLDELRSVTFDPGPVLCGIDAHVGDGLSAKTILADPGLDIGQAPPARQRDEQHAVSHHERDVSDAGLLGNNATDQPTEGTAASEDDNHVSHMAESHFIHEILGCGVSQYGRTLQCFKLEIEAVEEFVLYSPNIL